MLGVTIQPRHVLGYNGVDLTRLGEPKEFGESRPKKTRAANGGVVDGDDLRWVATFALHELLVTMELVGERDLVLMVTAVALVHGHALVDESSVLHGSFLSFDCCSSSSVRMARSCTAACTAI